MVWHVYNPLEREPSKRGHLVMHAKIQNSYHMKENTIPTAAVMQPEIDEASCTQHLNVSLHESFVSSELFTNSVAEEAEVQNSEWYLFNDFHVTSTPSEEAFSFNAQWKVKRKQDHQDVKYNLQNVLTGAVFAVLLPG